MATFRDPEENRLFGREGLDKIRSEG